MCSSEESPGSIPEEPPCQVFVYGTLRAGGRFRPLGDHLVTSQVGGSIRGCIYHFAAEGSRGDYPFIVEGDSLVRGEVLGFSDWELAIELLDRIEGAPHLYTRPTVSVLLDDGSSLPAQCYFIRPEAEQRGLAIESGDWLLESEIEEAE